MITTIYIELHSVMGEVVTLFSSQFLKSLLLIVLNKAGIPWKNTIYFETVITRGNHYEKK